MLRFKDAFSRILKLGIKVSRLMLKYHFTKSCEELTISKDCVTRKKEGRNDIFYVTGDKKKKAVENSPFIEKLKKS